MIITPLNRALHWLDTSPFLSGSVMNFNQGLAGDTITREVQKIFKNVVGAPEAHDVPLFTCEGEVRQHHQICKLLPQHGWLAQYLRSGIIDQEHGTAVFLVNIGWIWRLGHFLSKEVNPGHCLIESMALGLAALLGDRYPELAKQSFSPVFLEADGVRFKGMVPPKGQLVLHIWLDPRYDSFENITGGRRCISAYGILALDGKVVASGKVGGRAICLGQ